MWSEKLERTFIPLLGESSKMVDWIEPTPGPPSFWGVICVKNCSGRDKVDSCPLKGKFYEYWSLDIKSPNVCPTKTMWPSWLHIRSRGPIGKRVFSTNVMSCRGESIITKDGNDHDHQDEKFNRFG